MRAAARQPAPLYVANFGHHNQTYGTLGGAVLPALAVGDLRGAPVGTEPNAELERGRRIAAGEPSNPEPYVEPRDTRRWNRDSRSAEPA